MVVGVEVIVGIAVGGAVRRGFVGGEWGMSLVVGARCCIVAVGVGDVVSLVEEGVSPQVLCMVGAHCLCRREAEVGKIGPRGSRIVLPW